MGQRLHGWQLTASILLHLGCFRQWNIVHSILTGHLFSVEFCEDYIPDMRE